MVDKEEWRDIIEYEGLYKISSYGNVYSVRSKRNLKIKKNISHGYNEIELNYRGKVRYFRVHRLVAFAFIDKKENCDIVMHLDNNKTNNYYKNLKWGTVSENTKQAFDDGLINCKKIYILSSGIIEVCCLGHSEVKQKTGLSSSTITKYIKTKEKIKIGKYVGFKIIKCD